MEPRKILLALALFALVIFIPSSGPPDFRARLIVWNVGQGQWVSLVGMGECWHFDTGGEFMNWSALQKNCGSRKNRIFLSHWDHDHIGFAAPLARRMNACLQEIGPAPRVSSRKRQSLRRIPKCDSELTEIWTWRPSQGRAANELSLVFGVRGALLPGDSPKNQETQWVRKMPRSLHTHLLVLGHHGSRTSTSQELLTRLPHLRIAISSARFNRYGHPHRETVELLKRWRIPLLKTEDWGSIAIEL